MPGDERQLAIDSTGIRPPKIIAVAVNRMASFINAIERDIEPEPWKREIVRIAAELPCAVFWRKDNSDVLISAISIQIVLSAPVQLDDIAPVRITHRASRFEFRHFCLQDCFESLLRLVFRCPTNLISYISDGCELIQLDSWASRLFLRLSGNERRGEIVLGRSRQLL